MNKRILPALVVTSAAISLMLASAPLAGAHVTVDAPDAEPGGYTVLTFRVPTESDDASTTGLTVTLPEIKSVRTEPIPGWTSEVIRDQKDGAATKVRWQAADSTGIAPGQFGQFRLSVGPLPSEDTLPLPAAQSYSDGSVVEWFEEGSESEYPAPVVQLTANTEAQPAATSSRESSDDTARWLGGAGLVLGALGAVLGFGAFVRKGRE
ncbi:YcnI family copper-binding membrane protein [Hoyosella subflava]|uniref:Nuclear export factor GLE1 n=1 Tax=Hoyosella subflava (strain DSM 45089 / JCM 17490 / NBRC 109087 / DQS3-9A1) TaxID=443218 RepID=F6ERI9_HOYSD|nr:YcnI family protein [Hoyosella subflava]AEF38509.1 Nuclear export factor GLE1 [Hoyosella subflava DQS3-9A1]